MTAKDIVIKRTGMSDEDADFYVGMAEAKVRSYLSLDNEADLSPYMFQVSDIAVLYWQKDQSTLQSRYSLGYGRESFQEGSVRHTTVTMTGEAIFATYDAAVTSVLETLDGMSGEVYFL